MDRTGRLGVQRRLEAERLERVAAHAELFSALSGVIVRSYAILFVAFVSARLVCRCARRIGALNARSFSDAFPDFAGFAVHFSRDHTRSRPAAHFR